LVNLINKIELLWGKMLGFVSGRTPAIIGKNVIAAKLKKIK
jgi:hypothetical protein